ncbi:hypothetical protein ACFX15_028674 [Malus domestica]
MQVRSVGALLQFQLIQARSVWCRVTVSAHAGKECWCCLLCSCRPGVLVLPFMLVQTRSVDVAFYARADQELCAMQFRLMQARSLVSYSFRLVRTRSFGSCSLGSCEQGALVRAV